MTDHIVMDLDDFEDSNASSTLSLLDRLFAESQGRLEVTLFTIPVRTSEDTLNACDQRPWIQVGLHGWDHRLHECEHWTDGTFDLVHGWYCDKAMVHPCVVSVFKAPYWIASDALYAALLRRGFSVAEHPRNAARLPRRLSAYILSPEHYVGAHHKTRPIIQAHGHVQDVEGNGLRERLMDFMALARSGKPYKFVREVVE